MTFVQQTALPLALLVMVSLLGLSEMLGLIPCIGALRTYLQSAQIRRISTSITTLVLKTYALLMYCRGETSDPKFLWLIVITAIILVYPTVKNVILTCARCSIRGNLYSGLVSVLYQGIWATILMPYLTFQYIFLLSTTRRTRGYVYRTKIRPERHRTRRRIAGSASNNGATSLDSGLLGFGPLRLVLVLLTIAGVASVNPNVQKEYNVLPGVDKWDGTPFHDFRFTWFAQCCDVFDRLRVSAPPGLSDDVSKQDITASKKSQGRKEETNFDRQS